MRPFLTLVIVLILTALAAPVSHAQRDTIAPPVGGVYQAYYDANVPDWLTSFLQAKNICIERFLTLNPNLDPEYIFPGTPITLPKNEPCYDYIQDNGDWFYGSPPRMKYYEDGQWLDKPYYSTEVIYLPFHSVRTISQVLNVTNICLDALLRENYALAHYRIGLLGTGSLDVFLPVEAQPCDPMLPMHRDYDQYYSELETLEITAEQLNPLILSYKYNVCVEEFLPNYGFNIYQPLSTTDAITLRLQPNVLPCYNEQGQRLRYFGDDGKRLEQPEYTDLQVYITQQGDTIPSITAYFGACVNDFLRINNFPQLPTQTSIELFIPEPRQCREAEILAFLDPSSDLLNDRGRTRDLPSISLAYNICVENLSPLNPHLFPRLTGSDRQQILYSYRELPVPVLLPTFSAGPCYGEFVPTPEMTDYDIERALNVCQEAHIRTWRRNAVFYRLDSKPCYNEQGQRLRYTDISHLTNNYSPYKNRLRAYLKNTGEELSYSPFSVYILQPSDHLIDISRRYNVCIENLIEINPNLRNYFLYLAPTIIPIFMPDTSPCYDEATGIKLSHRDDNLSVQVDTSLIHYGIETPTYLNHFYNVCINHIEDANRAKLDGEAYYLGWIIPTDRPPCYSGRSKINYACYAQNGLDAACFDDYSSDRFTLHTIGAGESLSSIAAQYSVEVWEITWANRLDMRQPLWPNQTLIIPKQSTSAQIYALVLGTFVSLLLVAGLIIPLARQRQNRD